MIIKKYYTVAYIIFCCLFGVSALSLLTKAKDLTQLENGLQIEISTSKETYLLGEPVIVDFDVKNNASSDVRVNGINLDSRYITLYIAADGKTFKKYNHTRINEGKPGIMKASQHFKSSSTILWNFSPLTVTKSLNPPETDILTDYAFPMAGEYTLKAVWTIINGKDSQDIESKPVRIFIKEPIGEDLEVWNKIKDNGDFGYFIQESEIRVPRYKVAERAKFKQNVEQIILQQPNGLLVGKLRQSLETFNQNEIKLKEFREKNSVNPQTLPN